MTTNYGDLRIRVYWIDSYKLLKLVEQIIFRVVRAGPLGDGDVVPVSGFNARVEDLYWLRALSAFNAEPGAQLANLGWISFGRNERRRRWRCSRSRVHRFRLRVSRLFLFPPRRSKVFSVARLVPVVPEVLHEARLLHFEIAQESVVLWNWDGSLIDLGGSLIDFLWYGTSGWTLTAANYCKLWDTNI